MVVTTEVNFNVFNLLLKAKSKDVVMKLVQNAFNYRNSKVPSFVYKSLQSDVGCDENDAEQLFGSLQTLVKQCLYESYINQPEIIQLFPENFHKNLKELLSKIIAGNMNEWRSKVLTNQVSLPKLVDFDWRVDVKTSSDSVARMSMPTCIVQMKIQENATTDKRLPELQCLNVELSKKTLDTMLDGLGKIRDQLSSVAKTTT